MYRILVEDEGTEGFGVLLDERVQGFALLTKRRPTEVEWKAEGVEEPVVATLHRGWGSDFELLGVLEVERQRVSSLCLNFYGLGLALPDGGEE